MEGAYQRIVCSYSKCARADAHQFAYFFNICTALLPSLPFIVGAEAAEVPSWAQKIPWKISIDIYSWWC